MTDLVTASMGWLVRGWSYLPFGRFRRFSAPIDEQVPDPHLLALATAARRFEERTITLPPVAAREAFRRATRLAASRSPDLHDVRAMPLGHLAARLYVPEAPEGPQSVLVYFHGGGGVVGDLDTADDGCRWLAAASGWVVLSAEYQLAPENPYPAALEDAVAGFEAAARLSAFELGFDVRRWAVGGDSFGAMLATQVCRRALRNGGARPSAQLLIYPVCDYGRPTASRTAFAEGLLLTGRQMGQWRDLVFGSVAESSGEWGSPLVAPSLEGQPPALVVTAGLDPLRDEGRAYAARLRAESGNADHLELPGQLHGFCNFLGVSPGARAAWKEVAEGWRRFGSEM